MGADVCVSLLVALLVVLLLEFVEITVGATVPVVGANDGAIVEVELAFELRSDRAMLQTGAKVDPSDPTYKYHAQGIMTSAKTWQLRRDAWNCDKTKLVGTIWVPVNSK